MKHYDNNSHTGKYLNTVVFMKLWNKKIPF